MRAALFIVSAGSRRILIEIQQRVASAWRPVANGRQRAACGDFRAWRSGFRYLDFGDRGKGHSVTILGAVLPSVATLLREILSCPSPSAVPKSNSRLEVVLTR